MAKITLLEQKTYNNKPSGFKVTLDDGRSGNLEEKQSDKGLRVGDEVFVTEIPYTSKAGNKSTLYGLHLTQGGVTPSGTPQPTPSPKSAPTIHVGGKSKEEIKCECAIRMLEAVLGGFFDGKVESAQVPIRQLEYTKLLWTEVDEAFSGK